MNDYHRVRSRLLCVRGLYILLLCGGLAASGCTLDHSRQITREWVQVVQVAGYEQVISQQGWVVPKHSAIYVARPQASAVVVQQSLCRELGQYFPMLTKGRKAESVSQAAQSARARHIPFVIYPLLRDSHDGRNSFQELDEDIVEFEQIGRDRLRLQLLLYDAVNLRLIDSTLIDSSNPWFTWQRHKPQDLLPKTFSRYARVLSGVRQ